VFKLIFKVGNPIFRVLEILQGEVVEVVFELMIDIVVVPALFNLLAGPTGHRLICFM